jgi:integrase
MPDRRTRRGKRDLALLHLLGSAGLRRAEAAKLLVGDVDERRRAGDGRLREAIGRSTSWWVTVRYGKRGRTRAIPLDEAALAAIAALGEGPSRNDHRSLLAVAAAHRPATAGTVDTRRRAHRCPLRAGGWAARGSRHAARPAPHLLHAWPTAAPTRA